MPRGLRSRPSQHKPKELRSYASRHARLRSVETPNIAVCAYRKGATVLGLGRGLISPEPQTDRCEFDEGEEARGMLLIPGRDTLAVLDPVEEPIDEIAIPTEVRAEADWISAIASRRDVRPAAF